jgi:hypothetical protein
VSKVAEIDELKMVYQQVIEGCSYSPKGFFIKHLCEIEQIEVTRKRLEFIQQYVEEGIPTEEERLDRLRADGDWTNAKDEDIKAYRQTLSDNERMLASVIPQQQSAIRGIIEDHRKSLIKLLTERKQLVGTTAEELADKDNSYFFAYLSLYKDRPCKQPLFEKWEDFEALEEIQSHKYLEAIDHALESLNERNIRRISALPFFLNGFSYCKEHIFHFLSKPVCQLTNYQVHLFSMGNRNLNILSQAEGAPPEYFDKVKADEIVQWYDTQYSIIIGKRKQ